MTKTQSVFSACGKDLFLSHENHAWLTESHNPYLDEQKYHALFHF